MPIKKTTFSWNFWYLLLNNVDEISCLLKIFPRNCLFKDIYFKQKSKVSTFFPGYNIIEMLI